MKTLKRIKQDLDKTISLAEDEKTHTQYIQKELKFYDKALYQKIQSIKNPYLPKIYVIQENNGTLFLLEEYIQGETLENKQFSEEEIKNIMHQLCCCLHGLHTLNPPIIHRDIKPENVIYHNGKITLLDFGIARFQNKNKSKDTQILGTVGYAAPEQFGFEQSNPQTDIYALGKLMNYICNGSLDDQYGIPNDFKTVILKATQLDYKNRYANVHDMDLAIQGKTFIIPCINNESKKSKFISFLWTFFFILITYDMKPSETITNSILNSISCFLFLYFGLILYYNKTFFKQHFPKIQPALLYTILFFIFMCIDIWFFMFLDTIF